MRNHSSPSRNVLTQSLSFTETADELTSLSLSLASPQASSERARERDVPFGVSDSKYPQTIDASFPATVDRVRLLAASASLRLIDSRNLDPQKLLSRSPSVSVSVSRLLETLPTSRCPLTIYTWIGAKFSPLEKRIPNSIQ